ncbi:dTDP-4-amino-4,6-dideoxygalactose transaminase [Thermonema lapsum]|uniref:dTDP-4-amino-4,6-dideoxygalactose transaminase n=1 Tax=Thermonema lapsum TaxID=28195 RepID=A0A846MM12_9BACT|nr:dTDP-4-amino-4,6-dideoxygalactose transaminase [Thermonema lapsum]NIK72519.1 dTDP-4-amino-4,6-dideoxygalactose transaminase [Thermonema lapsum]
MHTIGFNKPYLTGKEVHYMYDAVFHRHISGNGKYTKLCHQFFQEKYHFNKVLLTSSCTDALEMSALLINIQPGDEVIMPSYTFVSTANAFILRGANIKFIDSYPHHPNMNPDLIEECITSKTKAIVVMHYAGAANDMKKILSIANKYNLYVIEDAAQCINSFYIDEKNQKIPLGSIGDLSAFSFHETKNIISGEGGMLVVNNKELEKRAEIIWEKGTNRSAFFRGEVDKYGWVDIGSSFLPSDIIAAFLYAQLEELEHIQQKRLWIWNTYYKLLKPLADQGLFELPYIPEYATNNAHMFYLVCRSLDERTKLIQHLKNKGIQAVFHYLSLHSSPYYKDKHDGRMLPNADKFADCLVRLPFYYDLSQSDLEYICEEVKNFFSNI